MHVFVDSAIRGYKQYKEIWEASYGEKGNSFNPFVVSLKDKEIIHILIAPSSHVNL